MKFDWKTIKTNLARFWNLNYEEKNAYLEPIVMTGQVYLIVMSFWVLLAVIAFLLIFVGISYYFPRFKIFLEQLFSQWFINLLGVAAIGIGGFLLYYVRREFRIFYAVIEIGFALSYGWLAISKARNKSAGYLESVAVVAVIYLVVRGLDNLAIGREERQKRLKKEAEAKAAQLSAS